MFWRRMRLEVSWRGGLLLLVLMLGSCGPDANAPSVADRKVAAGRYALDLVSPLPDPNSSFRFDKPESVRVLIGPYDLRSLAANTETGGASFVVDLDLRQDGTYFFDVLALREIRLTSSGLWRSTESSRIHLVPHVESLDFLSAVGTAGEFVVMHEAAFVRLRTQRGVTMQLARRGAR